MPEFFLGIFLIFIAIGVGAMIVQAIVEALPKILAVLGVGFGLFVISSIFFGFSAEAAAAQGITSSVAIGVMKAKMIGL